MQVLLHADPHTDGSAAMADHVQTVVKDALGRFGERITRVEAHLSSVDSQARGSAAGIQCSFEARLVGLDAVVVKDEAGSAHQAIEASLRKLKRAVGAAIAKQHPRHHQTKSRAPTPAAEPDPP